tara:strand:+ start:534 stop:716 length:183 start_codon:yes stop_codon:yes gene_type:complete
MALINQWIAFNALYAQWDQMKNDPCSDHERTKTKQAATSLRIWRSLPDVGRIELLQLQEI